MFVMLERTTTPDLKAALSGYYFRIQPANDATTCGSEQSNVSSGSSLVWYWHRLLKSSNTIKLIYFHFQHSRRGPWKIEMSVIHNCTQWTRIWQQNSNVFYIQKLEPCQCMKMKSKMCPPPITYTYARSSLYIIANKLSLHEPFASFAKIKYSIYKGSCVWKYSWTKNVLLF